MCGTYELWVPTSVGDRERIIFVLNEKSGVWRGALLDVLCRTFIMEDGVVSGTSFLFHIPPSLTIFGDVSMDVRGTVDEDAISGELITAMGHLPYSGKRISDSVFPIG